MENRSRPALVALFFLATVTLLVGLFYRLAFPLGIALLVVTWAVDTALRNRDERRRENAWLKMEGPPEGWREEVRAGANDATSADQATRAREEAGGASDGPGGVERTADGEVGVGND